MSQYMCIPMNLWEVFFSAYIEDLTEHSCDFNSYILKNNLISVFAGIIDYPCGFEKPLGDLKFFENLVYINFYIYPVHNKTIHANKSQ